MGNKKALFAVGTTALTAFGTFVACGSDKAKSPDAAVVHDSPVTHDAPADAAPDASPYDFTCYGGSAAGSATATITIAGTTGGLSGSAAAAVPDVALGFYKSGTASPVSTTTSGSDGTYTSGTIDTGGTPFDGYIRGAKAAYRVSYLYPPSPVVASLTNVPVPMIAKAQFDQLNALLQQNDATNGALFLTVTDCANMPITGATLSVKQNGTDKGTITDLGQLSGQSQLNGIYIVSNVPDGATDVSATFGSMTFPVHHVIAHKQEFVAGGSGSGSGSDEGTLTITVVRPGP